MERLHPTCCCLSLYLYKHVFLQLMKVMKDRRWTVLIRFPGPSCACGYGDSEIYWSTPKRTTTKGKKKKWSLGHHLCREITHVVMCLEHMGNFSVLTEPEFLTGSCTLPWKPLFWLLRGHRPSRHLHQLLLRWQCRSRSTVGV